MLADMSSLLGPPPTQFIQETEGCLDGWEGEGKFGEYLSH